MAKWNEISNGWFRYHYCSECGCKHFNPNTPLPTICPDCHSTMESDGMYMNDLINTFIAAHLEEWENFRDNFCKHQTGTLNFHGDKNPPSKGCSYHIKRPATCRADWRECKYENCPFLHKGEQNE